MFRLKASQARNIVEHIEEAVCRGELALPPLPQIATRLTNMLLDEEHVHLGRVAELMHADPAIAASVLRVANSASFGDPCSNLNQAIFRLGLRRVGVLVTAIAHKNYFVYLHPERAEILQTLWNHAVASGLAAERIAAMDDNDPKEAFLAGLLHDVGKLLVLRGIHDLEARSRGPRFEPASIEGLMEFLHAELGHAVLSSWGFPEPICQVVLRHHESTVPAEDILLLQVQAADLIASNLRRSAAVKSYTI